MDNYLLQIIRNENEINAAKSHLCHTEEDVDPQSETQNECKIRGYFSKPKGVREQKRLGDTTWNKWTIS
jgi:hypothetical protein